MTNFKAPRRGGNVVHKLDVPSMNSRRARRLIAKRRAEMAALARSQRGGGQQVPADSRPADSKHNGMHSGAGAMPPYVMPSNGSGSRSGIHAAPAQSSAQKSVATGLRDDQARSQIQLLERRLAKMSRLLDQRDQEILSRSKNAEDQGLASIYREVQGIEPTGKVGKQKLDLMSRILEANLKLRERVTSSSPNDE